jgi:hypothetical protein
MKFSNVRSLPHVLSHCAVYVAKGISIVSSRSDVELFFRTVHTLKDFHCSIAAFMLFVTVSNPSLQNQNHNNPNPPSVHMSVNTGSATCVPDNSVVADVVSRFVSV